MINTEIEFWSVADNSKIKIPRSECQIETIETVRGLKRRVCATFTTTDGKIRKLSKFVKEDFEL